MIGRVATGRVARVLTASMLAVCTFALSALVAVPAAAQSRTAPVTMEGVHQRSLPSALLVSTGGATLVARGHAPALFRDPALLTTLTGPQVALSTVQRSLDQSQVQHYAPVRYYPNLSLLLEGLTDRIPDPPPGTIVFTPADSVQRPHDAIGANWDRTQRSARPVQGYLAMPVQLGDVRLAAGLGATEYGDFGYFYQDNNVLSPDILDQRPVPLPRPTDLTPLEVDWHQVIRHREGSVMGYGGAVAAEWARYGLALGVSGVFVRGSTDDVEEERARGRLTFFSNAFQLDSLNGHTVRTSRSEFSGFDAALSAHVRGERIAAGLTLRPPMTLTRRFETTTITDGTALDISGEDQMRMPWRGHAGVALSPRNDLTFGLEYEVRPFADARYRRDGSDDLSPWLSSSAYRFGVDFSATSWLSLRGGFSREADPFSATGWAIDNDPVWHTAYAFGAGFAFAGAQLNLAVESRSSAFEDVRGPSIHYNDNRRLLFVADLVYTLDRFR